MSGPVAMYNGCPRRLATRRFQDEDHLLGCSHYGTRSGCGCVVHACMKAQTVISNESLVSTTFVVNRKSSTASCGGYYCKATTPMFRPISVKCPAATGKTCTLNIALDARTAITGSYEEFGYQFLLDGKAPGPGPTDGDGFYLFSSIRTPGQHRRGPRAAQFSCLRRWQCYELTVQGPQT